MNSYKLNELIDIRNGTTYYHLNTGSIPLYGSGGLMSYVDDFLYNGEAVLLPRKGTLNNILYTEGKIWTVDTMYYATTNKLVLPYYLYCYLSLLDLGHLDSGSALPSMTKSAYYNIEVRLPDIPAQSSVVNFIKNIDQKIELNNKANKELEAMAKLIYEYWFIQFDFPDVNGKPYKSSGGKMVYNKTLKREIPDRWSAVKLENIISRTATGLNPRKNFILGEGQNYYITIKSIKNGKIIFDDRCDRVTDEALKIIDKRSDLQVGDVLFTSIQPVGITYFIQEKPTNWNINESVFTLRANPERVTSEFLYMMLSSKEIKAFTKQSSAGSIHKGIRHGVLKEFNLPYGEKEITESFSEVVNPILQKSFLLDKENQKLEQLREWLLPMLMNGQVKIN